MTTRAAFLSFTIPALMVLLLAACGTPERPDTSSANLIVPGQRIGDLPPLGTAGSTVRAMDYDDTDELAAGTYYHWVDDANEPVKMLFVCASVDEVSLVYIYNAPANERFATAEGIGLGSSQSEVIAALGEPDSVFEWEDNRQLRFFTVDDVPGLIIRYQTDALDSAYSLWIVRLCE